MISLKWVSDNYLNLIQIATLIVVTGELITRLTPTKKDDGFVKRIGTGLDRLLTILRVPNLRRQIRDGSDLNVSKDMGPLSFISSNPWTRDNSRSTTDEGE